MSFVHLHTRSDYSVLQSTLTTQKLVEQAYDFQMPGIALTDVDNLFGAIEFFTQAQKMPPLKNGQTFNPIIGTEINVASLVGSTRNEESEGEFYKLVLIAENLRGYKNICKLSTASYTKEIPSSARARNLMGKPFVTISDLEEHQEGIIVLTAGAGGELFRYALNAEDGSGSGIQYALSACGILKDVFGSGQVFVELQSHNYEEERIANRALLEIAKKAELPLVATNQVCYLETTDRQNWDTLFSIGEKSTLRMGGGYDSSLQTTSVSPSTKTSPDGNQEQQNTQNFLLGDNYHLRSPQEMEMLFSNIPEAIKSTLVINERARVNIIDNEKHMPVIDLGGQSPEEYLRGEANVRLKEKFSALPTDQFQEYQQRLDFEFSIIEKMNFASYFIIVADFIAYARKENIMVGAGRGSAAGSLISYMMGITSLDPIAYGLYFERFLNPERISFPDIDIDFQDDRRDEVIDYVRRRYGEDNVAQIITFGRLKAKAVFKDVARVFGIDFETSNRISSLIRTNLTDTEGAKKTSSSYLEFNYQYNIDFASIINSNPILKHVYEQSIRLENLVRQTGIHAAGVVIADKPLSDYIPLSKSSDDIWVTQYDGSYLESSCGLLKIDFLGIKTLTVLQKCVDDVKRLHNIDINIAEPPLDDKKSFSMFAKGLTAGVFQFESDGMTAYLKDLIPEDLKELTAMNALYRPGPMAWIPVYISKKHGRVPEFSNDKNKNAFNRLEHICANHSGLRAVLEETRGIPFYQEQIMEICKVYAGFTLGEADNVRKAMGKKDKLLIQKSQENFISGAVGLENSEEDAQFLYDEIIIPFAGYGFNKSHSACYAYLAYQTAYLKANHSISFMTALLNSELEKNDTDKIGRYLNECFLMQVEVYPPDINYSNAHFTSTKDHIVYGLAAIKNIGVNVAEVIVKERKENGSYRDPIDFMLRHPTERVSKQVIEALIKSSCFDYTNFSAEKWMSVIGELHNRLDDERNQKSVGQLNLFQPTENNDDIYQNLKKLPTIKKEAARLEKESLGFSLRYEPLLQYREQISKISTIDTSQLDGVERRGVLGCIVRRANVFNDRNNKPMGKLVVNDGKNNVTLLAFSTIWGKVVDTFPEEVRVLHNDGIAEWLVDKPFRVRVQLKKSRTSTNQLDYFLEAMEIIEEEDIASNKPGTLWIKLSSEEHDERSLAELHTILQDHPGKYPVRLVMDDSGQQRVLNLGLATQVSPSFKKKLLDLEIVEKFKVAEQISD